MGIIIFFGICLLCFIGAIGLYLYREFRNETKHFEALRNISEHNKTLRDKEEFDELARWEQSRRSAQQKVYPHENFNQNEFTPRSTPKTNQHNPRVASVATYSSSSDLNFGSGFYDSSSWADSGCGDSDCGCGCGGD